MNAKQKPKFKKVKWLFGKEIEIPEEWKWDMITNYAEITTGDKDTQNKITDGKYPFFVRSQHVENINSYSYDGEAVLTAGDGVGTGKVFHYINGKFDFHQRVYKISDFASQLSGYFFYLYFSQNFLYQVLAMSAKNSVDSVRMEMIAKMKVPIPPLPEQTKIASILSRVDACIESTQKVIDKTERLKKGLMQQLLTRGIGHKKFKKVKWLFGKMIEIPEEWNLKKISKLGNIITGSTPTTQISEYYGNDYLWASPVDLENTKFIENTQSKLSNSGFNISRKIPKNSILVVCIGSTIGKIGIASKAMTSNQQINSIVCNVNNSEFVYYSLLQNNTLIKNLANQVAVPILNKTDFGAIRIILPCNTKEQTRIASILSGVDATILCFMCNRACKARMILIHIIAILCYEYRFAEENIHRNDNKGHR